MKEDRQNYDVHLLMEKHSVYKQEGKKKKVSAH